MRSSSRQALELTKTSCARQFCEGGFNKSRSCNVENPLPLLAEDGSRDGRCILSDEEMGMLRERGYCVVAPLLSKGDINVLRKECDSFSEVLNGLVDI